MTILQDLWYGNIRPNEDKIITVTIGWQYAYNQYATDGGKYNG